ncbi:hypothetical protein V8E36_006123 [Tilletia maclaganii]
MARLVVGLLRAAHDNPTRKLLSAPPRALSTTLARLVSSIKDYPPLAAFKNKEEHGKAHLAALSRHPPQELFVHAFGRAQVRVWLELHGGLLGALLSRTSLRFTDWSLTIPAQDARSLAIRWRAGTVFVCRDCFCGEKWDRGHTECVAQTLGWRDVGGEFSPDDHPNIIREYQLWASMRREAHADLKHVFLLDFLLGHSNDKWHAIAVETLTYWSSPWLDPPSPPPPSTTSRDDGSQSTALPPITYDTSLTS